MDRNQAEFIGVADSRSYGDDRRLYWWSWSYSAVALRFIKYSNLLFLFFFLMLKYRNIYHQSSDWSPWQINILKKNDMTVHDASRKTPFVKSQFNYQQGSMASSGPCTHGERTSAGQAVSYHCRESIAHQAFQSYYPFPMVGFTCSCASPVACQSSRACRRDLGRIRAAHRVLARI